jgi:hypothetical protein
MDHPSSFRERFMYERKHGDGYRRLLFLTEYEGKKLCEQYGEDPHKALADVGLVIVQSGWWCIYGGDGLRRRSGRL